MKKYRRFTTLAIIIAAISCSKEEEQVGPGTNNEGHYSDGSTVTFVCKSTEVTKITIGEKESDGYYYGFWAAGDALAVYKTEDNSSLGTAALVSGAGEKNASFSLESSVADGTSVRVLYPATATLGTNEIPTEQNGNADINDRTIAYSSVLSTSKSAPVNFSLTHTAAICRVIVGSDSFSGGTLNHIIFRSMGNAVSGTFTTNFSTGIITPSTTEDYVKVNVGSTLSTTPQDIWFTCLPGDFSGASMYIALNITKDGSTFTIPVAFSGKQLSPGKITVFNIPDLSESNCVSWYEPHDTRLMVHPTYAYGEANTFFIQCKSGSTYTGATYTPNPSIPNSVAVSIKARGDFTKVVNPIGSEFEWAKNSSGTIYTMRMTGYVGSDKVNPRDNFTFSYDGATTVTVSTKGAAYAGAPILLMKKGGKTLWAFNFWNIAADGTTVDEVTIDGYKFLNMDIGQATTQYATWKASATNNPVYRTINKYQWGRFVPVFWETNWTVDNAETSKVGNVPTKWGPVSLEEELANPLGIVANKTLNEDLTSWCSDNITSAWGGCAATTGTKAVMDPCPKGYRVPDKDALAAIKNSSFTTESTLGYGGIYSEGSLFIASGIINARRTSDAGLYISGSANTGTLSQGIYWSNYNGGPGTNTSYGIQLAYSNPAFKINVINSGNRTIAASVRCQVDENNR